MGSSRLGRGGTIRDAKRVLTLAGLGLPASVEGTGGHIIQDEGTPLAARGNLNFVGGGVTTTDDEANNATTVTIGGGGIPPGYFGDGSDGDVTISADADLSDYGPFLHFDNLTIDAGKVLTCDTNAMPIVYVKNTLTINGTIRNNGENGGVGGNNSGASGGSEGSAGANGKIYIGVLINGINGAVGGDATVNGTDGGSPGVLATSVTALNDTPLSGAAGGDGSGTGAGTGGTGGAASTGELCIPARDYARATNLIVGAGFTTAPNNVAGQAAGGGGGANDGGGGGGGNAGFGGIVSIIVRHIVWGASGAIEVIGGNGGNGGNSDGDGGGGGGGAGGNGGIVILCCETETGTRNVDVSGGTGGTGGTSVSASAGENGPDGYDGVVIDLGMGG